MPYLVHVVLWRHVMDRAVWLWFRMMARWGRRVVRRYGGLTFTEMKALLGERARRHQGNGGEGRNGDPAKWRHKVRSKCEG